VPDVFEVYIGGFSSTSYGLWWDGRRLVYESFVSGYEDRRQVYVEPSGAQWARFWRTMDELDVWSWTNRYATNGGVEPKRLARGATHWSLSLQHDGRRIESAGDSSGPGATDRDDSERLDAFTEAVSRLTGGYRFA
jgi:hypothetical protein